MARTAAFTGSAAWPSLSISGGGTAAWNALSYIGTVAPPTDRYETISTIVSSSSGVVRVTNNLGPTFGSINSTSRATDASTYLMPTANLLASGECVLICATSCHSADHFHEVNINGSTGSWKQTSIVYTKVAETSWNNGTTWVRQTAWIAYAPSWSTTGQVQFQTSTAQGQNIYNFSGGAYTAVGTAVTTQNFSAHFLPLSGVASGSSYAAAVRTSNNRTATAASGGGPTSLTFANNFSYSNNRAVAYFTKLIGANPNNTVYTNNGYAASAAVDGSVNSSPTAAQAMLTSTVSTDDVKANRLAGPTMTMTWSNTTNAWGGFMLEIVDAQVVLNSDTFTGTLGNYAIQTASGAQSGTESRATVNGEAYRTTTLSGSGVTTTNVEYGSPGLVSRVCNVAGTDYGITAQVYTEQKTGATTSSTHNVSLAILSGSSVTSITTASVAATGGVTGGINLLTRRAMRVENNPTNTGLWIAFKAWNPNVAEPAWPQYNANSATWAADSVVVSITDTATTGVATVAGTTGTAGLLFPLYASNSATTRAATETYGAVTAYSDLVIQNATATISGLGDVAASGFAVVTASMAASGGPGAGSLDASGVSIVEASVTVASGAGSLAVDGYAISTGDGTISGVGSLVATGTALTLGDATLTNGSSALTTTENVVVTAAASIAGAGSLTADADVVGITIVTATATMTGTGTLSATGVVTAVESATCAGTGDLSAILAVTAVTSATPTGDGTLSGAGYSITSSAATMTGTGTVSGDPAITAFTIVNPHGTGSLSAAPSVVAYTSASATGAGILQAAGYAAPVAGAGLYGQGTLDATATVIAFTDATLVGTSSGTLSGSAIATVTATLSGSATLSGDPAVLCVASATCAGTGSLDGVANTNVVGEAILLATSSSTVEASLLAYVQATLSGIASGTAAGYAIRLAPVVLAGVGSMVVVGKPVHDIPDTLRNTTTRALGGVYVSVPVASDGEVLAATATTSVKVGTGIMVSVEREQ